MAETVASLDFSGLGLFWRVVDLLLEDTEPDGDTWRALFASPGYRALTFSEFTPEFFKERWRLAFKPSLAHQLDQVITEGKGGLLKHYREVLAKRDALRQYQRKLDRDFDQQEEAKGLALAYLPPGDYEGYPPVAFVIFAPDGRGYRPIVIDLLKAMQGETGICLFLAHEAHHYWRGPGINPWGQQNYVPGMTMPPAADLLWVIDQINTEGVADMVNVPLELRNGVPWALEFQKEAHLAPAYLRQLDQGLRDIGSDGGRLARVAADLRQALPGAGHPIGFYMAQAIEAKYGPAGLAAAARDPVVFFELYRRSAIDDGKDPVISNEAIQVLRTMAGP